MRTATLALLATVLAACAADPGAGKTTATLSDGNEAPVVAPVVTSTLPIDPARSTLAMVGAKVTAQHDIALHDYTGEVGLDGDEVVAVSYTAQMDSIEADHPKLTKHLVNEDFFDVARFPTSSFRSVEIQRGAETAGMTHTVTGDLTIRGVTHRVSFPARIELGTDAVSASSEFVIDRQDFGVAYPGRPDDLVKDNVLLKVAFVAPRQTPPKVD